MIRTLFISILLQHSIVSGQVDMKSKVNGLIYGTLFGDALGGPIEFQGEEAIQHTPNPPKLWRPGEIINQKELADAAARLHLRSYHHLRPAPEPYGQWTSDAPPGTVTDDSRHKIILMHLLRKQMKRQQLKMTAREFAGSYLAWAQSETIKNHPGYDTLCAQWYVEISKSIQWLFGNRKLGIAYPPERLWNALPTCIGQMALTPLAAIYPEDATKAYLAAYELAFLDNGFAKDMNAALVAGLSKALTLDPKQMTDKALWSEVIQTIKETDPYAYAQVPWCPRAVIKWLDLADTFAVQAKGSPHALFERLTFEFRYNEKWEAHVPLVVCFSVLQLCQFDPLAALQLSIEWGWDSDTYPQLLGAFIGALYGEQLFQTEWKTNIAHRLRVDYDEDISTWQTTLLKLQEKQKIKN